MLSRLAEKIAVVTGAASGIGKATSVKFASEGASVVLVDLNKDGLNQVHQSLTKDFGDKHLQACGDASDSTFVKELFSKVVEKYGTPGNVLVNNAGIIRPTPFPETTEKNFDDIIRINLKSVFLMTKAFTTALKTENGMQSASIINMSSISGKAGSQFCADYASSKAGIIGFTKTVGIELGKYGVRCNAVLPGIIVTPMIETSVSGAKQLEMVKQLTPLRRLGLPEDVANVCLFLASDESAFVTCGCIEVAGGSHA